MGLFDLFEDSPKKSRPTTKKIGKNTRVNINEKSVSVTRRTKNTNVTVSRHGIKARIKGFRII